ncbi:hypothetical protein IGI39_000028 [Enterococcus sp. AZ135]
MSLEFLFLSTYYATWYFCSLLILARVSLFVCFLCKLDFRDFTAKKSLTNNMSDFLAEKIQSLSKKNAIQLLFLSHKVQF